MRKGNIRIQLFFLLIVTACTNNNFKNNKGKKENSPTENAPRSNEQTNPEKKSAPSPEAPSQISGSGREFSGNTVIQQGSYVAPEGFIGAPVIGLVTMASKYQITNEGYRVSIEQGNEVLASAPMNLRSVMDGEPVDMQGSAYGRPFMTKSAYRYINPKIATGAMQGTQRARVSICLPENVNADWDKPTKCRNLNNLMVRSTGPNSVIGLDATVEIKDKNLVISSMDASRLPGNCGTQNIPCVSLMHPIFNFAANSEDMRNDNESPLVIDLNQNNKIDLISVWNKSVFVFFPISANEKQKIRTGWVAKEDALLALDVDGNGTIDNAKELFGEYSAALENKEDKFTNGYLALAQYDDNKDLVIDSKDKIYSKLLLWQDKSSDGRSDKQRELFSLKDKNIKSIDLHYTFANPDGKPTVEQGNEIRLVGTYTTFSGKTYPTADVWFELRLARTIADILEMKRSRRN